MWGLWDGTSHSLRSADYQMAAELRGQAWFVCEPSYLC